MLKFDIQKFEDDEVKDYGSILDGATENDEEDLPPIPAELNNIPEDVARDIMKNAAAGEEKSVSEGEKPPNSVAEEKDGTSVPYNRFKDVVEQKSDLEKQLAAYRERYGDISATSNQSPAPSQPQFNESVIKQIEAAITERAMQISGLSKEDIDNLDYIDDTDPRIPLWNHAKKLSEMSVYNDVLSNHVAQQQELQRMQMLQNQSVNAYNNYFAQKQAAQNFDDIRQYATGEFFNAQSPIDKEILTDSFARLSQNRVTPSDMLILRDFFDRAERSYLSKSVPASKPKPSMNFPRTNQLQGSAGTGTVTETQLAEMLRTKKWSEIPPKYQKMLLGI